MRVGDLVRKHTSIKGVYNYGIVIDVSKPSPTQTVKVAWANSNPKNPWMMANSVEVINESR